MLFVGGLLTGWREPPSPPPSPALVGACRQYLQSPGRLKVLGKDMHRLANGVRRPAGRLPSQPSPLVYLAVFGLYLVILILIKEVGRDYETFRKMVPL
jgi:hypothetical protein